MLSIQERIAAELDVGVNQVAAAVGLLDDGATVPFVARYRKEVTGGLDDVQLRALEQRLGYLRELEDRREAIVKSITEQGKMTPALEASIREADSKARLEDLYLPYKPRRRTKGQIAREAGIEPLAELLLTDPDARSRDRGGGVPERRGRLRRRQGRARRCAPHPDGTLRRGRRAGGPCAPAAARGRAAAGARGRGQGGRGRQVRRLLRAQRAAGEGALAPRAGDVPRPQRGRAVPGRRPARCRRDERTSLRGTGGRACRHRRQGPRRQMPG